MPDAIAAPVPETVETTPAPSLTERDAVIEYLRTDGQPTAEETPAEPAPDAAPEPAPSDEVPPVEEPPVESAFTVQVPLPNGNGENGPTNAGTLELTVATQEAADTLRHHVKQSQRVARLEERVQRSRNDTATVDFLDAHPEDGLHWLAKEHPDASAAFLRTQVTANPKLAIETLTQLGFTVELTEPGSERAITAEARLAQREAADKVAQGQQTFRQQAALETYRDTALEIVDDLATTMGFRRDGEDYEVFATRASARLTKLWKDKGGTVTRADIAATLDPLVRALAGKPADVPRAADGTFAPKPKPPAVPAATTRKLAGPAATSAPPLIQTITKLPPNASLYDLKKIAQGQR